MFIGRIHRLPGSSPPSVFLSIARLGRARASGLRFSTTKRSRFAPVRCWVLGARRESATDPANDPWR